MDATERELWAYSTHKRSCGLSDLLKEFWRWYTRGLSTLAGCISLCLRVEARRETHCGPKQFAEIFPKARGKLETSIRNYVLWKITEPKMWDKTASAVFLAEGSFSRVIKFAILGNQSTIERMTVLPSYPQRFRELGHQGHWGTSKCLSSLTGVWHVILLRAGQADTNSGVFSHCECQEVRTNQTGNLPNLQEWWLERHVVLPSTHHRGLPWSRSPKAGWWLCPGSILHLKLPGEDVRLAIAGSRATGHWEIKPCKKYLAHLASLEFSLLAPQMYSRFLWSVHTMDGWSAPSSLCLHSTNAWK